MAETKTNGVTREAEVSKARGWVIKHEDEGEEQVPPKQTKTIRFILPE